MITAKENFLMKIGDKVKLKSKTQGGMTLEDFLADDCEASQFYRKNGYITIQNIRGENINCGTRLSILSFDEKDLEIIE